MFCGQSSSPSPLLLLHCVVSPHSSQFVESVVQHLNVQIDVVQLEPNETNSKRECANTLFTELCMFPIRDDLLILFVIQVSIFKRLYISVETWFRLAILLQHAA